ncbi:MAG: hypothetical protein MZW92_36655 [Comamonadaceae bacterium]|nr:hypothetical protein [Comamonadaceae bacterium]
MPFGEFIPRGFRWFTDADEHPARRLRARRRRRRRRSPSAAQRVAPNICYEDLFGEELARALRRRRPRRRRCWPTSATSAGSATPSPPPQHLNISRMRSAGVRSGR